MSCKRLRRPSSFDFVRILQAKDVSDVTMRASYLYFEASHWKGQLNQSRDPVSLTLDPFHHEKGQVNLFKYQPFFYFFFCVGAWVAFISPEI